MKILIVEDEVIASRFLEKMINDHFEDCKVIGIARSTQEALELYNILHPDVLIMDINLGDHLSFELFDQLDASKLNVIFTTGYQEFALRAFKVHAIDYVMKPINIEDLKSAIHKAMERLRFKQVHAQSPLNSEKENKTGNILLVWENDKLRPVEIDKIIKIKSDRNYSSIFLTDDKEIFTSKSLGVYEELLKGSGFFRIHKSCLINILHFVSYSPGIHAKVELSDSIFEIISRRKKDELMDFLNKNK